MDQNFATRSQVQRAIEDALRDFKTDLITGKIQIPTPTATPENHAGGANHFPNSDINFSTRAAVVAGTLPGDVFDDNYEAFRLYWCEKNANVVLDAAHALKSVDHSLFAANEGVNTGIPIWDRVNGRILIGSAGATQYDVVAALPRKIVGPGDKWYLTWQVLAVTADEVAATLEGFAGMWQISAAYEGYAKGDAYDLLYEIIGTAGTNDTKYRVLSRTDSGLSILSNVLDVPNAPDALSGDDYPKLYLTAGSGFMEHDIYRLRDGIYDHLFTIRNQNDLQYNDTGTSHYGVVAGWPVEPQDRPIAYAQTGGARSLQVGVFGGAFQQNGVAILVPGSYKSGETNNDGQFVRFGLNQATAVDRQIAFDKFVFDTNWHTWSPDNSSQFTDAATTVPSVSPNSGSPASGGTFDPPDPGSGGGFQREFTIA